MPTITGTVERDAKPLGGAYVRLLGPSGEFVAEEYTPDDGRFTFHVVDGTWTLEVRAANSETARQEVGVTGADETLQVELMRAG